jgi:hypothetical protein
MPYHNEAKGQPARMLGKHGWDAAGNCTRCGEAGRCKCDHRQRKLFATVKPKESHDALSVNDTSAPTA